MLKNVAIFTLGVSCFNSPLGAVKIESVFIDSILFSTFIKIWFFPFQVLLNDFVHKQ